MGKHVGLSECHWPQMASCREIGVLPQNALLRISFPITLTTEAMRRMNAGHVTQEETPNPSSANHSLAVAVVYPCHLPSRQGVGGYSNAHGAAGLVRPASAFTSVVIRFNS